MRATFENTYQKLPEHFFSRVRARQASAPKLIAWNQPLADFLNIEVTDASLLPELFSGNRVPEGASPVAQVYAGHQFGNFNPRLGDGRALLLGEVRAADNKLYDIQLKGAGPTPYSRAGDGLAAVGPVLREYLLSEFMHRLGVPTTRALAFCTTGDNVYRAEVMPGAVLTRMASSHVRVGTFEYFLSEQDGDALKTLLNFCVDRHYPELPRDANLPISFLAAVVRAQAELVAQWMALGFIHGVMNTDNTSVAAITIDYGPCAFMDVYNPDQVYSSIDRRGRYAYSNQARIAHWNLLRLAECVAPLCEGTPENIMAAVNATLGEFPALYEQAWCRRMGAKLGVADATVVDRELIESWLKYLHAGKVDFTLGFRNLPKLIANESNEFYPPTPERNLFLATWRTRVGDASAAIAGLDLINPVFIPRNHQVEHAIQAAQLGDFTAFNELQAVLEDPFTYRQEWATFATPPREDQIVAQTFCGT